MISPSNVQFTNDVWTFCDVFPGFTSLAHHRVGIQRIQPLCSSVLHSIGYGWSMCSLRLIDNKSWVCFTLTPTLRLCYARNSSHLLPWNTGKYEKRLLYHHRRFVVFLQSCYNCETGNCVAVALIQPIFLVFYVTMFRFCYVVLNWMGKLRFSTEFNGNNTCVSHITSFFSHISNLPNIFPPLFEPFCDKLSCDVRFFRRFSFFFPWIFTRNRFSLNRICADFSMLMSLIFLTKLFLCGYAKMILKSQIDSISSNE